jgi:hypothetical protein
MIVEIYHFPTHTSESTETLNGQSKLKTAQCTPPANFPMVPATNVCTDHLNGHQSRFQPCLQCSIAESASTITVGKGNHLRLPITTNIELVTIQQPKCDRTLNVLPPLSTCDDQYHALVHPVTSK